MGEMLCTLFQPDMALGHEQKNPPQPDTALIFFSPACKVSNSFRQSDSV